MDSSTIFIVCPIVAFSTKSYELVQNNCLSMSEIFWFIETCFVIYNHGCFNDLQYLHYTGYAMALNSLLHNLISIRKVVK